jgi:pimeloyl-ACP methyl ester carboxylesterase
MKLRNLFFVVAGICLLMACDKSDELITNDLSAADYKCASDKNHHHGLDQDRYVTMRSTGLKVHYRIIGKGPVDIVFIPGWTNPLEIYSKQFDFFKNKARCIYIDIPGQGLSDAPEGIEYTMGLMADAIFDVVKKEGVHHFIGVGFSMGHIPLGQFELRHPGMLTKLVNIDGSYTPWPPIGDPAREAFIAELYGFCDWIATWDTTEKKGFASLLLTESSPEDLVKFVEYFYIFPSPIMANIYRNQAAEDVNQPIGWTFPILCIYSVAPTNMDYEQLYFPNADIHVFEGGHVVQWEKSDEVNSLIWEFVDYRHGKK